MQQTVGFALGSYLPRTYTWVYNQLRFFRETHVLILTGTLNPDRIHFPINQHELFAFPGLEIVTTPPPLPIRVLRKIMRLLFIDSRLDLLFFAWKAKRCGCSLIHGHFADKGWKFLPVAKMLGVPLIISFYGCDYDFLPNTQPKWKKRYQTLFKHASLFLTEGKYGRKSLIEKGARADRVKVCHLGVDTDGIEFKVRQLQSGQLLKLVQVASFVEKKGHRILIEGMKLLKDKDVIDRVSLTLIGAGPLKQEIIDLTEQYHLDQHITFVDHVPYQNLHQELLKYHVFIHPSRTASNGDCEGGAPVVLLDAQATGMPVVSTYHCDIPEEVIDGATGILVPEGECKGIAEAILRFLDEPKLLSELGSAGRKHVEEHYSAKRQAEKLALIYSNLTNA